MYSDDLFVTKTRGYREHEGFYVKRLRDLRVLRAFVMKVD
jgi:hypothetical protein